MCYNKKLIKISYEYRAMTFDICHGCNTKLILALKSETSVNDYVLRYAKLTVDHVIPLDRDGV